MRISYFVHGRGRGHASRSASVIERLQREGHEVEVSSGGDAWGLLQHIEGARRTQTVLPGCAVLRLTPKRVSLDRARFREFRPELVISDGDMPSVIAARSMGIRTLAIGHDLVFTRCQLPQELCVVKVLKERVNSFHTRFAAEGVAVNFLPVQSTCERTLVARPDFSPTLLSNVKDEGHVVAYFRDANAEPIVRSLAASGREVRLFSPRGERIPGVDVRPICREDFMESMVSASAVVGSIGSNLVAEAIALSKSFLGVHKKNDAEQALNAGMVRSSDVGMVTTFEANEPWVIQRFMDRVALGDFRRVDTRGMRPASEAVSSLVMA